LARQALSGNFPGRRPPTPQRESDFLRSKEARTDHTARIGVNPEQLLTEILVIGQKPECEKRTKKKKTRFGPPSYFEERDPASKGDLASSRFLIPEGRRKRESIVMNSQILRVFQLQSVIRGTPRPAPEPGKNDGPELGLMPPKTAQRTSRSEPAVENA